MLTYCLAFLLSTLVAPVIHKRPIEFTEQRKELTHAYMAEHYGKKMKNLEIEPRIIVVHWTGIATLEASFRAFNPERLPGHREDLRGSALNVSAHFLIDRDGTIYQLMPDNWMARHVIGLNLSAIGIENVGGVDGKEDLTKAQVEANASLVHYLKKKYPKIEHVIGHYEYRSFEKSPIFKELVSGYRTTKIDPGPKFMKELRDRLSTP